MSQMKIGSLLCATGQKGLLFKMHRASGSEHIADLRYGIRPRRARVSQEADGLIAEYVGALRRDASAVTT